MWKQKIKICSINLMAYNVVLVIMAILSVCSRLYGQENRVLSLERTKLTVPDIDTTKLSISEYEKPFPSPHFDAISKMSEMLLDFCPDYTLNFPADCSPLHKGEYGVGGVMQQYSNSFSVTLQQIRSSTAKCIQ